MKKLILTVLATSFGINVFAQATVIFNNSESVILTHVFAPASDNPFFSQIGNGPNDRPPGTTGWGGPVSGLSSNVFTRIGATNGLFLPVPYSGATTYAQLIGAPGYNVPESGLLPASGVTTFRTGGAAGTVAGTIATFSNIPVGTQQATLEMVAWDNITGLYPTWAQASVAWLAGVLAAGSSGTWNQDGMDHTPFMINSTDPTQHAQSFNLYFIPEPTTAALTAVGAIALLTFRRRK